MAKRKKPVIKNRTIQVIVITAITVLILLAVFFLFFRFVSGQVSNYLIENKYYGFKLQTPKGWVAEEKTAYSEDNITQILTECKSDKSDNASVYEIGATRFKSQRYPQDFAGYLTTGFPSGVILEVTVNCIPDSIKSKVVNSISGNLKVAGEQALEEVLNSPEFGKTNQLSFLHDNIQYKVREYVYISPSDKNGEQKLIENYAEVFNKIISSFNFAK